MKRDSAPATHHVDWPNLAFLGTTFLVALTGTPWYIATRGLGWPEVCTFVGLWLAIGISITAGYHRLVAHRSYRTMWPVRLFFLVFGAGALETAAYPWAADHRLHHTDVDQDDDPYNIQKGFWWAHIGWVFLNLRMKIELQIADSAIRQRR